MVFDKISTISSYLTDEVPLWNTYRQTRYGSVSEITYQNYIKLNSLYDDYKSLELDEKTKFVIGAAIYVLYECGFEFNSFYEILDEGTEKKEKDEFSHSNIGTKNKWELKDCLEKFIKANFPKIDSGDSYEISKVALFNALEKLNWNLKNDDDYNFDYKNRQLQTIKNQIRPIFLFYFYRSSDNFEKFFWKDLNNLLLNEFSVKNRRNFFGESVERKYLNDWDFLEERFSKNECLELINLFDSHNIKKDDWSSLKSEKFIEEVDTLKKSLEKFFCNETALEEPDFEKLFSMFLSKFDENAGFCALVFSFMENLSYEKLESYFPPKDKKIWKEDAEIYLEIEEEDKKNSDEQKDDWFTAHFKATLPDECINHDVSKNLEAMSNERIALLTKFFFFAIWKFLECSNINAETDDDYEIIKNLKKNFLTRCKSGEWKTQENLKDILNKIAKICKIAKENPFSQIDFYSLNKSSHFKSNQPFLLSFYNFVRFSKVQRIATLNQLDFIDTYTDKIYHIDSKTYKPQCNFSKITELDCGFGEKLYKPLPFEGVYYPRPFKFKLWQHTDRFNLLKNPEKLDFVKNRNFVDFDLLSKEQKNKASREINRSTNKNNLYNHYFYSIDRNMMTHFSIHKSIEIILQDSEKLLEALFDVGEYFENLSDEFKNLKNIRFLRKKFERIESIIKSEKSDGLYSEKGEIKSNFDLKEDFGIEFYNQVQSFFEEIYVSDDNLINQESFGLWIYMLYITFSLAFEDAKTTTEETVDFAISDEELEKASHFMPENSEKNVIAYHRYFYQLREICESKNLKKWEILPSSIIAKLHNGDFDSVPKYVKKMNGVMEAARFIFECKSKVSKNPDFSQIAKAEWKETAKDNNLNKTLSELSLRNKYSSLSYEKIITVNGIRQKIFSSKYRNFKVELSAVLNKETDEFEIYIGKKTSASQVPVFSFTRFKWNIQSEKVMPSFGVLNKIEIDKTIIRLIDNFIKSFVENYFSKVDFIKIEETATEKNITLEELSNKITEFEKNRKTKIQNEIDKICNERKSKNDYEIHKEKLDELYDKQRFWFDSYFLNGNEYCESFIRLSVKGFEFQLVLSEDKKTILVFKYKSYRDSFKDDTPLFTIPVSAYEILFDFSFEFLKALYDEKNEINYDSELPEMNEIKKAHSQHLAMEYQEYLKNNRKSKYEGQAFWGTYCSFDWNREKEKLNPQDEVDYLELDLKYAIERMFSDERSKYDSVSYNIRTMKEKGEISRTRHCCTDEGSKDIEFKYKIEGYKLDIWSHFENENENQNFAGSIGNFVLISPTADGSSLNMKLLQYNYGYFENCDDSDIISTVKIPACQYRKIFVFERKLREYWEKNHKSYYIEIEHTNDFGGTWIEKKNNFDEQKRGFEEVASQVFGSEYDSSVKFTPLEFYKTMNFLEIKKATPYCFTEKKEVNGIKQILLSTGLELFNFTFALIPVNFNTEIEVYFESKKSESDKPFFKFDKNCVDSILKFLGGIVYRQLEIANAQ